MTKDPTTGEAPEPVDPEEERRRRAKLRAKVFGDVLPETTSDESDQSFGDKEESSDEWLRRQVPPHHGTAG